MKKLSVSLGDKHLEKIDEKQDADGIASRSEALREILNDYDDIRTECDRLNTRCEELEAEVERVKNEKRLILEEREEHTELVNVQQRQQSLQEQKAQASIVERAKWWLTGMPEDAVDA